MRRFEEKEEEEEASGDDLIEMMKVQVGGVCRSG